MLITPVRNLATKGGASHGHIPPIWYTVLTLLKGSFSPPSSHAVMIPPPVDDMFAE